MNRQQRADALANAVLDALRNTLDGRSEEIGVVAAALVTIAGQLVGQTYAEQSDAAFADMIRFLNDQTWQAIRVGQRKARPVRKRRQRTMGTTT